MDKFVKNNKELVLLILTWLVLIFYTCLKLFFGYYVEAAENSNWFRSICNFIDNNFIITFIISCTVNYVMFYFYYCALLGKRKLDKREKLILLATDVFTNLLYGIHPVLNIVLDLIKSFVIPIIYNRQINLKFIFKCFILAITNIIFQMLSIISRNVWLSRVSLSSCTSLILSLDVLLMIILLYVYINRIKEGKLMFFLEKWFAKKEAKISWLKTQKSKVLKKIDVLKKEADDLDAEIKKVEEE